MNIEYSIPDKNAQSSAANATTWTQIEVTCALEHAEAVAQLLLDAGGSGVQTEDTQILFDQSEDAQIVPREQALVTSYFAPEMDAQTLQNELRDTFARGQIEAQIDTKELHEEDWANSWRENFPALHIGPFLIVPPWETHEEVEDSAIVIRLDPGLAFGTGQHPTTRMCLELLGEQFQGEPLPNRVLDRVLDVGCGSGILSIACAKLGAEVWASDLDHFCTQATTENARENNVEDRIHVVEIAGADWTTETFPLVVANLMSDLLIMLAPQLFTRVQPNGSLIVSGISAPRANEVEAAMHAVGFYTQHKREQDGEVRGDYTERWTAFVFGKQ